MPVPSRDSGINHISIKLNCDISEKNADNESENRSFVQNGGLKGGAYFLDLVILNC